MYKPDDNAAPIRVGQAVTAPDGHSGVVRYLFKTADGPVAVVKFADDYPLQVLPVRSLSPDAASHH